MVPTLGQRLDALAKAGSLVSLSSTPILGITPVAISLQDQLRKSGLISSQKAKQANAQKRKKNKQVRAGAEDETVARREQLALESAAQVERDRELNREKQKSAQVRAVAAQIVQLVEMNTIDNGDESVSFNFTFDGKIRTLHIGEEIRDALVRGHLAIVRSGNATALVPSGVAQKIAARDTDAVVLLNEGSSEADATDRDDPYAEFEVPDDLMW